MKQSECESGADGKKKVKNLDFEGQVDEKKRKTEKPKGRRRKRRKKRGRRA